MSEHRQLKRGNTVFDRGVLQAFSLEGMRKEHAQGLGRWRICNALGSAWACDAVVGWMAISTCSGEASSVELIIVLVLNVGQPAVRSRYSAPPGAALYSQIFHNSHSSTPFQSLLAA